MQGFKLFWQIDMLINCDKIAGMLMMAIWSRYAEQYDDYNCRNRVITKIMKKVLNYREYKIVYHIVKPKPMIEEILECFQCISLAWDRISIRRLITQVHLYTCSTASTH